MTRHHYRHEMKYAETSFCFTQILKGISNTSLESRILLRLCSITPLFRLGVLLINANPVHAIALLPGSLPTHQIRQACSMAEKCDFLELATELRLKIYAHVVVDGLASGCSKGLAGLFLACRTARTELDTDFIAKVRPLLVAQSEWQRTCDKYPAVRNEPLSLQSSAESLFSNTVARKLVITLPMPAHWILWLNPKLTGSHLPMLDKIPSFVQLISSLQPVLRLQWAELTIKLCNKAVADPSEFQDIDSDFMVHAAGAYLLSAVQSAEKVGVKLDIEFVTAVSKAFFQAITYLGSSNVIYFARTDRLILDYNNPDTIHTIMYFCGYLMTLVGEFMAYGNDGHSLSLMPKPKRGWIARILDGEDEKKGWKVLYDYRDGLPEVEGALWELCLENGLWQAKRLFTELDGNTYDEIDFENEMNAGDERA
jgi:hypothetical protein